MPFYYLGVANDYALNLSFVGLKRGRRYGTNISTVLCKVREKMSI